MEGPPGHGKKKGLAHLQAPFFLDEMPSLFLQLVELIQSAFQEIGVFFNGHNAGNRVVEQLAVGRKQHILRLGIVVEVLCLKMCPAVSDIP